MGDITAVGNVSSGAAFTGTQGTTLTFNGTGISDDETFAWDPVEDDFDLSNDLNLRDVEPHLSFYDTTVGDDDFHLFADNDQFVLTNLTQNDILLTFSQGNLFLPNLANCKTIDTDANGRLFCGTDTGGGGNSFETIDAPAGTDPVADSATDTLTLTSTGSTITATGDSGTDTINLEAVDVTCTNCLTVTEVASADLATLASTITVIDGTDATSFPAIFDSATGDLAIKTDAGLTYAADSGTLSATVLTEGANAVFNSSETPGGELGGTWASPTLDDSVTTTGWVMGTFSGTTLTAGTVNIDLLDAVGAVDMDYGSADVTDHTFTTDGTGDAEFVVPNESLGAAEIVNKATNKTFTPQEAKLSGAYVLETFASLDTAAESATIDGGAGPWKLLFDASTDEAAVWEWVLPDDWAAHGTLVVIYALASATTLEVEWEAAIQCTTPGDAEDIDGAEFADGATAGGNTVPGTAGHTDSSAVTLTDDSCAAGDLIYVYVSTDANDATNDDATGDRELLAVEYNYTTTQ